MKKIAVILLSVMMVFVVASSSLANSSIYLDYMLYGEQKISSYDLISENYIALGGTYQFDNKWSIFGEYTTGKMSQLVSTDDFLRFVTLEDKATTYTIKGSYAIVDNEDLRLDLSAGYYSDNGQYSADYSGNLEYESYLIGADALYKITDNITISNVFEYGLLGKATSKFQNQTRTTDTDFSINYKIGFNYSFTKQLGLSMGYRSSSWKVDDDKITTSGFTTGVTYKF